MSAQERSYGGNSSVDSLIPSDVVNGSRRWAVIDVQPSISPLATANGDDESSIVFASATDLRDTSITLEGDNGTRKQYGFTKSNKAGLTYVLKVNPWKTTFIDCSEQLPLRDVRDILLKELRQISDDNFWESDFFTDSQSMSLS